MIKGLVLYFSETDEKQQKQPIITDNVSIKNKIIDIMIHACITVKELAKMLSVTARTINRQIDILKVENKVERAGSRKTGYWKIN